MYFERGDLTKNSAFTQAMPQEHLNRPSYELGVKQASGAKVEQNFIRNPLKSQEPKLLSYKPVSEIYKEAKAKGLSYAEFKALRDQNTRLYLENTITPKSTAEVIKEARALGLKADEAIKAIKQNQKASLAGLKENERPIAVGEAITMQKLNGYSSSISLDDTHIYPLDFVVVKTSDVKPNMQAKSGVQTRTRGKLMRYESAPPIAGSSNGDGWYYVFHSRHDSAARHLAFDNVCLPRKHPFWQNHTPPLDWGCRCEIAMWSERQIKAKGIAVTQNIPTSGGLKRGVLSVIITSF